METIENKIRDWIVTKKITTGIFPDIPENVLHANISVLFFQDVNTVKEGRTRVQNHFTFTLKWSDLYKITFWPIWSEVKWFQFSKKWSEVKWSENKSLYGNLKWSEVTFTSQNFEVKWSEVRSIKVTSLHFKVIKKWRKSDFGQRKITLKWSEVTLYLQ